LSSSTVNARIDDKTLLMGLTVECPMGGSPLDCQWHFLRELTTDARTEYVRAMTDGEGQEVLCRHRECPRYRATLS
jgi:hypothetical protein